MSIETKPSNLEDRHKKELAEGSGIGVDVIEARGYRTVTEPFELAALGFSRAQRRVPGLLIPFHDVTGAVVSHQFKPDSPRKDPKRKTRRVKYETPKNSIISLDVPPGAAAALSDVSVPLWITEGSKKADAAVTAGLACISLQGVECWRVDDWQHVALSGRQMFIAYDSDVMTKDGVKTALDGLTMFLVGLGAVVSWVVFPPGSLPSGETAKVGLDDWLVDHDLDAAGLLEHVVKPESNIKTNGVALRDLTRQAILALQQWNSPERLFERDGLLVEAQGVGVMEVTKDRLTFLMSESANWFRTAARGDASVRVPVSPPRDLVTNVNAAGPELWGLHRLDRIVTTPVFAADGSLRTEPGYHGASRSYYMPPEGLRVRRVSADPSKAEIKEAKKLIDELFQDFEFVGASDRAHAWALLLQPFAREMIRGATPLYSVQAPKQGTGKTLLVQSALAPAVGVVDSYAEPHGDEEMEKRLTAVLREASPVLFFDNVDRFISYPSLASALTKPTWSGRVLGQSSTVTLPISCSFVLTANNPSFSEDMKRRVVSIRLDARIEDPSQRTGFTHSLPAWALQNRGELVWAACTVVAAWVAAGRPATATGTPALGSYGPWRRVMGGILNHVKVDGFLGNLNTTRADKSPDQETFEAICDHALEAFGEGCPWLVGDLASSLYGAGVELQLPKRYRDDDELATVLGYFLRSRRDQVVRGCRLERAKKRRGPGFLWRFVPVTGR